VSNRPRRAGASAARGTGPVLARRAAVVTLLVLAVALGLVIALTTPWSPWPGQAPLHPDAARDFTVRQIQRADGFHDRLRLPAYLSLGLGLLVSLALGLSPAGAALVRQAGRRLPWWPLRVAAGTLAVTAVVEVVRLPLDAWTEQVLRRYGISTQAWGSWLVDVAVGWVVSAVAASVALAVLVGLARRLPRWWFLPGAAAAAAMVFVGSFVYPLVVEPLYNSFTPMPAGPLRASLLRLARRDGVPVSNVLVADASRRTTAVNAYVSGFGSTRRIVVYDTLLRDATPAEVRLVVAHELGHAKRNDVLVGTATAALGTAAGVVLLALLLSWGRLLRRSGAVSVADPGVVALVLALASAGSVLSLPVVNLVSREVEARADVHSLDLTHDPAAFVAMQRRLAVTNLDDLTPPTLTYLWFADHPTAPERIAIARRWARVHHLPVPPALAP
jgi:STE24 endopeptidase